ncbi:MAG: NAD-dependent epimerase/dehydratase family protein [Acidimicrobiales bacterium]
MKALITGMGGFVGAHLVARLVDDGWDVTGTVRPAGDRTRLHGLDAGVIEADLTDRAATRAAVRAAGPHVAFLLAAAREQATAADRAATLSVNATSVAWVLSALTDRCRAVVRLGSSTEYEAADGPMDESTPVRPRGFFGATKAAGTAVLQAANHGAPRTAVLRAFQVYGPADHANRLVPAAIRAARAGATLPLTQPGWRRDWVYVDDVVEACVRTATADHLPTGQVLNIGTGRQTTNEELVSLLSGVAGRPIPVEVGAYPGCPWDTGSWLSDPSLARHLLGWEAKVPLDEGLRRCWEA